MSQTTKKEFIQRWKEAAGEQSLATIPANHISPSVAPLVESHEKNNITMSDLTYHCVTEPPVPFNIPTSDFLSREIALHVTGNQTLRRWQVDSTINFAAFAEGYPTTDQAHYAAGMLKRATDEWNKLQLGVSLNWVSNLEDAAFVLAYGGDGGSMLARAFVPNENPLNMFYVYKRAFLPGNINYVKNILLHEVGHVLGLQHEFVLEEEKAGEVRLVPRKAPSVMGDVVAGAIQEADVKSTRLLYAVAAPHIGTWPIRDYRPSN